MDLHNLLTFIAVAALLVISPGPNGLLITKTVPLFGKRKGFANVFGFVAAFYVHGTLSIFGISLILVQSAHAFFIFKMLGAAYLIWIGTKALISAVKQGKPVASASAITKSRPLSLANAFWEGFLCNVLNPKVSMFYLAAFPQFISIDSGAVSAYTLVTAHALVNCLWFSLMIIMLSRVKTMAENPSFKRWLSSITGIIFIGFGTKLALLKS